MPAHRLLEPKDRISEVLFGLIMALTVTNSLGVATHAENDLRTLLAGALGCNTAWGIIDATMYLLAPLSERGRAIAMLRDLRGPIDLAVVRERIADALPPIVASVLDQDELEKIRQKLIGLPEPSDRPRLTRADWLAAFGVFLLVFLSTLPVVIPFMLIGDARLALRASNAVGIAMLFLSGSALGRYSGIHPARLGLVLAMVGAALVSIAVALGG